MNARYQCVNIIQQILEQKKFFSNFKPQIPEEDLPFCNMLVLSVLRHLTVLQNILNKFLQRKIPHKQRILYAVLYCAATEILFLNKPDYAVINEYVNLAKKLTDRFCGGMVNAVLRKISAQKEELAKQYGQPKFPTDFTHILKEDYTAGQIGLMEKMLSVEPPLDLSFPPESSEQVEKINGTLLSNGTVRVTEKNVKISFLPGYREGGWWVQDLASSLPVQLLGDVKGKKVLDICAAPGGKTAQLLARGAAVTAVDIDAGRMKTLQENIRRLQLADNLVTVVGDGLEYLKNCSEKFDIIVADVPCSGTGTFRRHPEVLHIKNKTDVAKPLQIQKAFLQSAGSCLKSGGLLLYCTCSVAKAEGEKQIERFLQNNNDFALYPLDLQTAQIGDGLLLDKNIIDKGVLRTLPYYMADIGGMDSFFAACLQKK